MGVVDQGLLEGAWGWFEGSVPLLLFGFYSSNTHNSCSLLGLQPPLHPSSHLSKPSAVEPPVQGQTRRRTVHGREVRHTGAQAIVFLKICLVSSPSGPVRTRKPPQPPLSSLFLSLFLPLNPRVRCSTLSQPDSPIG